MLMGSGAKVLYIEDNPENRLLVRRILQADGFTVLEAQNAAQALTLLESEVPDLILMDINMPDIDGFTLTSRLKNTPKFDRVPIVALTANVMKGDRERSFEAGCDGYIQKPIDVDNLSFQVNRFIESKR